MSAIPCNINICNLLTLSLLLAVTSNHDPWCWWFLQFPTAPSKWHFWPFALPSASFPHHLADTLFNSLLPVGRYLDISTWIPPPQDCLYLWPSPSVLDKSYHLLPIIYSRQESVKEGTCMNSKILLHKWNPFWGYFMPFIEYNTSKKHQILFFINLFSS